MERKYLSAEQLGIPKWVRAKLVEVMGRLRCGELVHSSKAVAGQDDKIFDLGISAEPIEQPTFLSGPVQCGTVGCIGGWVALLAGRGVNEAADHVNSATGKLSKLYYPDNEDKDWSDVTPKQVGS